ncbi:MAG TPA: hypothetical protein VN734_17275 [Acidobacteriaceae bacterium]|nr:hypothetical protein [Acidobacteriaceae bacterium]
MAYAQKPPPPEREIILLACLIGITLMLLLEVVEAYRWYSIWSELFR